MGGEISRRALWAQLLRAQTCNSVHVYVPFHDKALDLTTDCKIEEGLKVTTMANLVWIVWFVSILERIVDRDTVRACDGTVTEKNGCRMFCTFPVFGVTSCFRAAPTCLTPSALVWDFGHLRAETFGTTNRSGLGQL